MKIISIIRNSLTHKSKQIFSFLKSNKIFQEFGKMKIRFPGSDILVFYQIFIEENYNFFPSGFNPKTIIDAGANVGYSPIWFSEKFKDAIVIAVEPESKNFKLLRENTRTRKNIHSIEAAIWSEDKKVFLKDPSTKSWSFETSQNQTDISIAVEGITITSIIRKFQFDNVDLLKIDIEGAEGELFTNNYKNWIDKVNCIMIETHDKKIPGVSKIIDNALLNNGFIKFKTRDLSCYYKKSILSP